MQKVFAFVKKMYDKLMESAFWKSVVSLSSGQIIAQAINLFTVPIVSRIYSKNAYGEFGILTSTATIIIGFIGLGLNSAIMIAKDEAESKKIFGVSFGIQLALSVLFCGALIALEPHYKAFDSSLPYIFAIIIMFVYISLSVLSSLMRVYINRLKMNKVLFANPLVGALSTLFITLPLGWMGMDSIGLYAANILSLIIVNIHMISKANPFGKMPRCKDLCYIVKNYKKFILFQYPANLMGIFTGQMPNQFIANGFGNAALGDYSMCNRIFGFPMHLIATPIQTVYFRTAAQKYRDGENIADFTYSLVSKLMLLAFVPIVILMSFGEPLFAWVLGDKWSSAGLLASVLALQYVFLFCHNCIIYCRVCINKQNINLIISIVQFFIIIGSLAFGVLHFKTMYGTILCFSIANLVYSIANITVSFCCLKKYYIRFSCLSVVYCLLCLGATMMLKIIFF